MACHMMQRCSPSTDRTWRRQPHSCEPVGAQPPQGVRLSCVAGIPWGRLALPAPTWQSAVPSNNLGAPLLQSWRAARSSSNAPTAVLHRVSLPVSRVGRLAAAPRMRAVVAYAGALCVTQTPLHHPCSVCVMMDTLVTGTPASATLAAQTRKHAQSLRNRPRPRRWCTMHMPPAQPRMRPRSPQNVPPTARRHRMLGLLLALVLRWCCCVLRWQWRVCCCCVQCRMALTHPTPTRIQPSLLHSMMACSQTPSTQPTREGGLGSPRSKTLLGSKPRACAFVILAFFTRMLVREPTAICTETHTHPRHNSDHIHPLAEFGSPSVCSIRRALRPPDSKRTDPINSPPNDHQQPLSLC